MILKYKINTNRILIQISSLVIIFFIFFISISTFKKVSGQIIENYIHKQIIINHDLTSEVTEIRERKINTDEYIVDLTPQNFGITILNPIKNQESLEKLKAILNNVVIIDEKNQNIDYTIETTNSSDLIIKANKYHRLTQSNSSRIQVNYSYPFYAFKVGSLVDIFIPGFSKDFNFITETEKINFKYTIKINKKLGEIGTIHPKNIINEDDQYYIIDYFGNDLIGKSIWIQIGKKQGFKFQINHTYNATTDAPFAVNYIKLIVPRNMSSGYIKQNVFFTQIEPEPTYVETDNNGNLFFHFMIPSNNSGLIIIEGFGIVQKVNFNHLLSGRLADIPYDIQSINTHASKYWEANSEDIKQISTNIYNSILNNNLNNEEVYLLTKGIYDFVINKIDYSTVKKYGLNERQGALKTLYGGAAVCMEYSDLFIALARSAGLPARAAFGHAYSSIQYDFLNIEDKTINHQWAEVYFPLPKTWVPVDTTWGETGIEVIGGDLNRFYLYVASISPENPATTEVRFVGSQEKIDLNTKYLIYPENINVLNIGNTIALSPEDILTKYPMQNDFINKIKEITLIASNISNDVNKNIDEFLSQNFQIKNTDQINLVKIGILISFLSLIVIYFVLTSNLRNKRKITHQIQKIKLKNTIRL